MWIYLPILEKCDIAQHLVKMKNVKIYRHIHVHVKCMHSYLRFIKKNNQK